MKNTILLLYLFGFIFKVQSQNVDLNNSTDYIRIQKNGASSFSRAFGINGSNQLYIGSVEETIGNIYFFNKGTDYLMTIKPDGNVGIGTTTPNAKLEVTDEIRVRLATNNVDKNVARILPIGYSGITGAMNWTIRGAYQYSTGINTNSVGGDLDLIKSLDRNTILATKSDGTSIGNVGIGTTSPTSKLEVSANSSTDAIALRLTNTGWSCNMSTSIEFKTGNQKSVPTSKISSIMNGCGNAGDRLGFFVQDTSTNNPNNNPLVEKLSLLPNGNLGVGTTSPDAKLAVNGNIHTKEVKVDLIGWSDFVFESNYNLPTLYEVETHIKEKGHLKDIPSAEEVVENGILLGHMNAKLLQKIEELTLYTIQQEKELQNQRLINKNLEARLQKIEDLLSSKK
ncbi:hypothetical protein CJ739_1731 [Mariniflexile rhizosphaerae]|uniref:hypothetical protein n=1 Tax=unclassified Mariniflexile TaxID=2643887 RepID=UPI000CBCF6F5|nr:hypothetical protein [Mariniflexile sp. TRM1-10]AXP80817.1 hypothetical protein CJ739_1731 [Mariniflexile sp. TRM1-10]PLB17657.1 MAG: hypothetical protein TRG1_3507 [Flavobacteriaceae bacterium FS1-H7996/R]